MFIPALRLGLAEDHAQEGKYLPPLGSPRPVYKQTNTNLSKSINNIYIYTERIGKICKGSTTVICKGYYQQGKALSGYRNALIT